MSNSKDGGPLTFEEIVKLSPEEIARYTGIVAGKNHVTLAVPRTLKGEGCDYTYYQAVCSCGWSGVYRASKLTAQEDTCPNSERRN